MTVILGEDRGDTLYVGSRKSDMLGRLYDKGRESQDPAYEGCWRWEVQYRRSYALSALRALSCSQDPAESIKATVASWFRDRGVRASFSTTAYPLPVRPARPVDDDARWLAWARKSVAPRAAQLGKRYGWRYIAETLVGPIRTYEAWLSLLEGIEIELEPD
jgi:hypothetical protein